MNPAVPLLSFSLVMLAAQFSPGPDMLLLMKNALNHSRRAALLTVVGISAGLVIHCSLILGGLAVVLSRTPGFFGWLRLAGGLYLGWLGVKLLVSLRRPPVAGPEEGGEMPLGDGAALAQGFLTNLFNAKAVIFLLATLTTFHPPGSPGWLKFGLAGIIVIQALIFWSLFVLLLRRPAVRGFFLRWQRPWNAVFGALLILGGLAAICSRG